MIALFSTLIIEKIQAVFSRRILVENVPDFYSG